MMKPRWGRVVVITHRVGKNKGKKEGESGGAALVSVTDVLRKKARKKTLIAAGSDEVRRAGLGS